MSPSNPNPAHPDYNPETGMKHTEGLRRRTEGTPAQHHDFLLAKEIKALKCHIHPPVPNPAPLGLIAFGLTTALLQMKHTRIAGDSEDDLNGVDTVVLGFAMFFGGLLQVIAGLGEVRRNNIFGYTAFLIFGGFWMSIGMIDTVSLLATGKPPPINHEALQAVLFMMGIFTFMMWVLTFKMNKTICSLFFLLGSTLWLLCFGVDNETADKVGGYFGLATAANAFWLAFAELVNDVIGEGKEIIPLGHWNSKSEKDHGAAHVPGRTQASRPSYIFRSSVANGTGAAHVPGRIQALPDIEEGTATPEEASS